MIYIALGLGAFACALGGGLVWFVQMHNREILAFRILIKKLIVATDENATFNLKQRALINALKDRVTYLEQQANGNAGTHEEAGNFRPGPKG